MIFSIIYVSSRAGSHAKECQEPAQFNYLNTSINKESRGLIPQILLSQVLYKAFASSTRVMELGPSFWNVACFLEAERLMYKFPHTNPVLHGTVYQNTSLLLHGVSFSHLLVLIYFFFFSFFPCQWQRHQSHGLWWKLCEQGKAIPIFPLHLMYSSRVKKRRMGGEGKRLLSDTLCLAVNVFFQSFF